MGAGRGDSGKEGKNVFREGSEMGPESEEKMTHPISHWMGFKHQETEQGTEEKRSAEQ